MCLRSGGKSPRLPRQSRQFTGMRVAGLFPMNDCLDAVCAPAPRVVRHLPFSGEGAAAPEVLGEREWLVTNGIGGYASATILGAITRRYHGLLIAALPTPHGRVVMLNQLSEELELGDGTRVELSSGLGFHDSIESPGFAALSDFWLEDGLPVWRYQIGALELEKRLFMVHGENTSCIRFQLLGGADALRIRLCPHTQFRPHEAAVDEVIGDYRLKVMRQGFEIGAAQKYPPLRLLVCAREWSFDGGHAKIDKVFYRSEQQRGYEAFGELCSFGAFEAELESGETATLIVSTEPWEKLSRTPPDAMFDQEYRRREALLTDADNQMSAELRLAADQFIIAPSDRSGARKLADRRTIIAGYHWFTDWGRDSMIGLEGLTLCTGRHAEARGILNTFAEHIRDGLIPNLFPEGENQGRYHTADATLWFFHAIDRYVDLSGDRELLGRLLPKLREIVARHLRGTRFGIGVDEVDGLLRQGAEGYQLTWMDAKVGDWVVTPRSGKAVEINALWYNALCLLADWLRAEGDHGGAAALGGHAERARTSFNQRFWYGAGGYLYDVVDGANQPGADDGACRPNQILAISLRHPVLDQEHWRAVIEVVRQRLLTPYGLRSLAPDHLEYKNRYFGDLRARDAAYHQGTVWAWLIGPFIDAWLKVYPDRRAEARDFLAAFTAHLGEAGIGTISEVFDAEPPFTPRGCISQAWSVAEVLRAAQRIESRSTAERSAEHAALPSAPLNEAQIDEILAESFPASDPPSWTLGRK